MCNIYISVVMLISLSVGRSVGRSVGWLQSITGFELHFKSDFKIFVRLQKKSYGPILNDFHISYVDYGYSDCQWTIFRIITICSKYRKECSDGFLGGYNR